MSSFADEVAALRGTKSATFKDLLTHPKFSRLLAAMSISSLGDWVGFTAVLAIVVRLGRQHDLFAVAGVMSTRMLPAILFGPFVGALVDRLNRKQLMIVADIGRGAMYATMPFLGRLWMIYVLSFLIECLSLLWTPSRDASLPNLVPRRQLPNANSLSLVTSYATMPLGATVFAVTVAVSRLFGARIPFFAGRPEAFALWLDAGTFAFSALMVSGIPIKSAKATEHQRFDLSRVWKDMTEGVAFLRSNGLVATMTSGIVVAFAAVGGVIAIGPVFAQKTLGGGPSGIGILITAFGIGMAAGLALFNWLSRVVDREFVFPWSMIAAAGGLFTVAAMPNLSLAATAAVGLGYACGTLWVCGYTLLQENVDDEFRGRTFGSLTVVGRLGLFLSLTVFPLLAALYGNHEVFLGGQRIDLSGTRLALWTAGFMVMLAGVFTRAGLNRHRLRRPKALGLMPKLKRPMGDGLFIAFEGVEGSGKGTQIELAEAFLKEKGVEVLVTREPGGTAVGEQLRQLLLDHDTGHIEPRTEALLFAASRAQHVASVIRPALAEGKIVVCDRYIDSSLAYQGWARGLGEQDVLTLNVWATQGLFPDLVILLHVEPEEGLLRSTEEPDRIEMEGGDFHAKVADAYLKIAEEHPERFVMVDASRSQEEVQEKVREAIERALAEREANGGGGGE